MDSQRIFQKEYGAINLLKGVLLLNAIVFTGLILLGKLDKFAFPFFNKEATISTFLFFTCVAAIVSSVFLASAYWGTRSRKFKKYRFWRKQYRFFKLTSHELQLIKEKLGAMVNVNLASSCAEVNFFKDNSLPFKIKLVFGDSNEVSYLLCIGCFISSPFALDLQNKIYNNLEKLIDELNLRKNSITEDHFTRENGFSKLSVQNHIKTPHESKYLFRNNQPSHFRTIFNINKKELLFFFRQLPIIILVTALFIILLKYRDYNKFLEIAYYSYFITLIILGLMQLKKLFKL